MSKLNRKQIQERALEMLEQSPHGIRWGQILKAIHHSAPETPPNSIHGAIQALFTSSEQVVKVARGTYRLRKYVEEDSIESVAAEEALSDEPVVVDTPGLGNTPLIDLQVIQNGELREIYEVKCDAGRQTLYGAIGQLVTHSIRSDSAIRTLVLPADAPIPPDIEQALLALQMQTRRYRLVGSPRHRRVQLI